MVALGFLAGIVIGALLPENVRGWVRGAWGWAWGRVQKRAPAAGAEITNRTGKAGVIHSDEVVLTDREKTVSLFSAAGNVAQFFAGVIGWCVKNPVGAIGIALIVALVVFRPFDFGKSRGELRLERELAEARADVAELEAEMGALSRDLAVNTERDRARRAVVIAEAEQDLNNAAAQVDPDALYRAYVAGYLCLLDASACAGGSDTPSPGAAPLRGAGADAA